jgi:hypothetical protein
MAEIIYQRMKRNGMGLKRFPFMLGSLAPDLCLSFIFRRHEYDCSGIFVRKTMLRLYEGRFDPCSTLFAYFMGIVSHYVCDYFCYSHSPAFRGNLGDHIKSDWVQHMPDAGNIPFHEREGHTAGFRHLMDTLDEQVRTHDHNLTRDPATTRTDITTGTVMAEWLAGAVFCSAEQYFSLPAAIAGQVITA